MKTTKLLLGVLFLMGLVILPSCLDDDDYDMHLRYPNALVTVKEDAGETLFFQLDDQTTLLPVNLNSHPFGGKEVRALVNYDEVDESSGNFDKAVHINWIDSIRTKSMAPNLGDLNDEKYGDDPVEIVRDWVTIAEDGYLTLRFRTIWSNMGITHHVNLIPTNNPNNPYEVEFRHDAKGDVTGRMGDGLVAFKLDNLPDTEGETVKLKLIWNAFNGVTKSVEFDYKTRTATTGTTAVASQRSLIPLK
ncbi:MAG: NigD-like protein [Fermentimonas sp.]|nr:NigD-like protein [Fermentimonas sp.]